MDYTLITGSLQLVMSGTFTEMWTFHLSSQIYIKNVLSWMSTG